MNVDARTELARIVEAFDAEDLATLLVVVRRLERRRAAALREAPRPAGRLVGVDREAR